MSNEAIATVEQTPSGLETILNKKWESFYAMMDTNARAMFPREKFLKIAALAVQKEPKIKSCTPASIIKAFLHMAQLGLEPDTPAQYGHFVVQNNYKAKVDELFFWPGFRGLIHLAKLHANVTHVDAKLVYQKDTIKILEGTDASVYHERHLGSDRGPLIGVYAIIRTSDSEFPKIEWMSKDDIDAIKNKAKTQYVWDAHYGEMAKKTVIRRAMKLIDKSPQMDLALNLHAQAESDGHMEVDVLGNAKYVRAEVAPPEPLTDRLRATLNG